VPEFVPIATADPTAVEALLDRAFGRDRHKRTAYAIRSGTLPIPDLSFAAIENGSLIGVIQCWPIELAGDDGQRHPLVMVGPVAVEPERQKGGLGKELVHQALDSAMELERDAAMMLIGDPEYYGRFWGFSADLTGDWRAPGPVEQRRVLARGLAVPAVAGMLGPRVTVAA
jgi:predicted N-acetyltransferase YhbS